MVVVPARTIRVLSFLTFAAFFIILHACKDDVSRGAKPLKCRQNEAVRRFRCICMFGLCMRALLSFEYKMGRCILFVLFIDATLVSWKIETMCIQRINFMCVNYIYDLFCTRFCFFQYVFHIFQEYVLPDLIPRWNGRRWVILGAHPIICTISYRQDRKAHGVTCTQKSEYSLAPNNKLLLLVFVNVEPLWLEQTNKCVW